MRGKHDDYVCHCQQKRPSGQNDNDDEIIIPVEPGVFALQGIQDLDAIIKLIVKRLHKSTLKVAGFLITKKEKTNVAADTLAILQQNFGNQVFTSMIPKNVALEEAH